MSTGLGLRIKQRRTELGLSQEELATRLGLRSKSTICKVERGDDNLTTDTIQKYADALETTPSVLMGWGKGVEVSGYGTDLITVDFTNAPTPSQEEIDKALDLFRRFKGLPPEKQTAFLTLLEVPQNDV